MSSESAENYRFEDARPDLTADLPRYVRHVLETLEGHGFEAFLVGGCVRDALLGRTIHDHDVATNARPEQVINLFPHSVPSGLAHGTVTVVLDHHPVEVTTYRTETTYSDGRHPDQVIYATSLYDDLERRDFTVNAMAMDRWGRVVDPMAGTLDLALHKLRAVGEPRLRFAEDGLRILRALRFGAQLGFTIDGQTHQAMTEQAELLRAVSMERVGQELKRIAVTNWFLVLHHLADGPYLASTRTDLTALQQAMKKLHRLVQVFPSLRWTRWRMYVGPGDDSELADPWMTTTALWVSHLPSGAVARTALSGLAWNKSLLTRSMASAAVFRSRPWTWSMRRWFHTLYEQDLSAVRTACVLSDFFNVTDSRPSCLALYDSALEQTPLSSAKDLVVSGRDLTALGLEGPLVGQTLSRLADAVLNGQTANDKDELISLVRQSEGMRRQSTGTMERNNGKEPSK